MKRRTQFGDIFRPEWGQSFDQFQHIKRIVYDREVVKVASDLAAQDPQIEKLALQFYKKFNVEKTTGKGGLGQQGIYELLAKLGIMLNEIESVTEREKHNGREPMGETTGTD